MTMNQPNPPNHAHLSGPAIMFITAAIFGYFGFVMGFSTINAATNQTIPYVVLFMNTMKIGAVAFAVTGILTTVNRLYGNLTYNLLSIIAAVTFVIVAIMDIMDQQTTLITGAPYILIIVAAFMGFMAVAELIKLLKYRSLISPGMHQSSQSADIDRRAP